MEDDLEEQGARLMDMCMRIVNADKEVQFACEEIAKTAHRDGWQVVIEIVASVKVVEIGASEISPAREVVKWDATPKDQQFLRAMRISAE